MDGQPSALMRLQKFLKAARTSSCESVVSACFFGEVFTLVAGLKVNKLSLSLDRVRASLSVAARAHCSKSLRASLVKCQSGTYSYVQIFLRTDSG